MFPPFYGFLSTDLMCRWSVRKTLCRTGLSQVIVDLPTRTTLPATPPVLPVPSGASTKPVGHSQSSLSSRRARESEVSRAWSCRRRTAGTVKFQVGSDAKLHALGKIPNQ